jgi:hypothetical protein
MRRGHANEMAATALRLGAGCRVTQGSPALRANLGLGDAIPMGLETALGITSGWGAALRAHLREPAIWLGHMVISNPKVAGLERTGATPYSVSGYVVFFGEDGIVAWRRRCAPINRATGSTLHRLEPGRRGKLYWSRHLSDRVRPNQACSNRIRPNKGLRQRSSWNAGESPARRIGLSTTEHDLNSVAERRGDLLVRRVPPGHLS